MRKLLIGGVLLAALTYAAPAAAGCWATAGLAPPPAGTVAGEAWTAEITVLQHGRYPLPNAGEAEPKVTIVHAATGKEATFTAKPSDPGKGRYEASVVFPFGGAWRYEVFDDFPEAVCAKTHEFGTVQIGGPAASAVTGGSGFPLWPGGLGATLLIVAGVAVFFGRKRVLRARRTAVA